MRLKRDILGANNERLTSEQFVQIYCLFESNGHSHTCPDGNKERVKQAVEILHSNLKPGTSFPEETFNEVFNRVDTNLDGNLNCEEIDLLFYLYSLKVVDPSLLA